MNLYDCNVLCNNLAQTKKNHSQDDSVETALLSVFLSCHQQSEIEVLYPAKSGVPDWFSWRAESRVPEPFSSDDDVSEEEVLPVYKLNFKFCENINWENKGLAFCAHSSDTFKGPYIKFCAIDINGVCIAKRSGKPEEHPWRLSKGHLWLYYIPFHTIIRRLGESGLPPPSTCLVKFEFKVIGYGRGTFGVHVVMPEDEDGVIIHQVDNADCSSEGDDGMMA
ncbi:uncharacterized protein LOC126789345 [Argentina anserina]|uniref:uncharacterized protein LOC126789345 n=1 Tax=Argentina anserina TaxID=57926 RepID=UPI0021762209|nr:uncharacterized protein LOC126789345 [Potentilla anserina]